ncbi:DUF4179 domain-containing protein [Paenibacillus sp. HW567]|uniref:DUF4179 domain-containing protein n=1 Tax=Paenibacillus sp. HW567 TaxID=1034769 RepID=UPI00037C2C05|nr:DUF4179 domain-containing protein [Paenibacillus sp. HW567]
MKRVEDTLKRQLSDNREAPYPDFEDMWSRMEKAGHTAPAMIADREPDAPRRHRNWRKITIAASLSALLIAVPVYAAINYNWDKMLSGQEGVQDALEQNLGQTLGQSVTRDGVKLTLHTAVVDAERTIILYTLDVDKRKDNEYWGVKGMTLTDAAGNGNQDNNDYTYIRWDEDSGQYSGYFESDWTPRQESSKAKLSIDALRLYQPKQLEMSKKINLNTNAQQSIPLGQDGLRDVKVQVFDQGEKLMLTSAISFDSAEAKQWADPQIVPYKNGKPVEILPGSSYGKPGENGEYTANQYFNRADLADEQVVYKLDYAKTEKTVNEPISFDLELSKKQMESGTTRIALDMPLEQADKDFVIEDMIVTPAQIVVNLRSKKTDYNVPYKKFYLSVNGKTLEGGRRLSPKGDYGLIPIRFERPAGLTITQDTPLIFTGKFKITPHEEDKAPLLLTGISEKKQSVMRETGGYPVKWTYYKQGADLYVETESEDARFGGVNQTYIMDGKERLLGSPVGVNFVGSDTNKSIDVYKDFKGTEASIYMFHYWIHDRDATVSVQLMPQPSGK